MSHLPLMIVPLILYNLGLTGLLGGGSNPGQGVLFLVEFLLVNAAATSLFFVLLVVALVDVLAGFSVSLRAASRDVNFR